MITSSRFIKLGMLAAAIAFLTACKVGPNYLRPNVTAPPAYRGADNAAVAADARGSFGDEQWAAVYREPELQELIRKALANNYDVRIAARRILEQQAQVRITRSQQFPSVTVGGTAIGATLPSSLGTQLPKSTRRWIVQSFRLRGRRISGVSTAGRLRRPVRSCWRRSGRSALSS